MNGMDVSWHNRQQPHTLLLWQLGCDSNQSETSITPNRILIEFIFGNKAKSFLKNMNLIQVNPIQVFMDPQRFLSITFRAFKIIL